MAVDESANVKVEFVYEPPQEGGPDALALERETPEEAQVGCGLASSSSSSFS